VQEPNKLYSNTWRRWNHSLGF